MSEAKPKPKLNIKFNIIPKTLEKPFLDLFPSYTEGLVRGEPGGYIMTAPYAEAAEKIYQLEPRPDDVWVNTFLKAGTTWVTELVWLLKNDLNFKVATEKQIIARTPYPEMIYYLSKDLRAQVGSAPSMKTPEDIDKLPSPRVLRPHLTLDLLHPDILEVSKVVYVARNPKDVIVSYYHFHKLMKAQSFTGNFDQFVQHFMDGEILATPYFRHVLCAWEKRHHPNMRFMFYEDMKMDLRGEIKRTADFLGKALTEEDLDKLEKHLHFSSFEKNNAVNQEAGKYFGIMKPDAGVSFMRKGIIGDWKNHFSPELNERVDKWIADNLKGTDLKFVTE